MNHDRTSSKDQFGKSAEAYLTSAVHAQSDELTRLVEFVNPNGGKVIDIGTGAGHMAYSFAPHVDQMIAFDLTPKMLEIVARESQAKGLSNVTTQEGNAEGMPFADAEFDGVICRVAAHHFHHVDRFVSEVGRILKPGGWFLLVDTITPEDSDAAQTVDEIERRRDPSHFHNLSVNEWTNLIEGSGMSVEKHTVRRKNLDFPDWVERMNVPAEDIAWLRETMSNLSGEAKEYFQWREIDGRNWFDLLEVTILAKKS
ncbi:MAG: methyltransferase domain-containing protein [Armatimonadetes bacterium]|nr:methyltransferase domain-containing protein [Armatimonadota bacterium]